MLNLYTDLELRVREFGKSIRRDEAGAGLVEYALLVALIAIVLIAALVFLSGGIGSVFSKAGSTLQSKG